MYRTEGTPQPVIPGTSIKGSIRTALLNYYLEKLPDEKYTRLRDNFKDERNLEKAEGIIQKELLDYNNERDDPLRTVLLSDSFFKATGTQLVGGLKIVKFDEHTETLETIGTQIHAEVLKGELLGGKASSELTITIDTDLQAAPFPAPNRHHERPQTPKRIKTISFQDICCACNSFYWSEFQDEFENYHYRDLYDGSEAIIVELKKRLEEAIKSEGQFVIRVGRWSQVEFVTFKDNLRKPKTKKDRRGNPLPWGTTRTLFDYNGKFVPMGWCVLSLKRQHFIPRQ
jgi:CRISPR-associated protein Csm5